MAVADPADGIVGQGEVTAKWSKHILTSGTAREKAARVLLEPSRVEMHYVLEIYFALESLRMTLHYRQYELAPFTCFFIKTFGF